MSETGEPAPCRYCAATAFTADEDGPAHPCCWAWRRVIAAGYACPACQIARMITAQVERNLRDHPDKIIPVRLPRRLPPMPKHQHLTRASAY